MSEENHATRRARGQESPVDPLTWQEMSALMAYRASQARGEDAGIPHAEAFRRVFGGAEA